MKCIVAYLNDHDIYCDPDEPTPGCKECEMVEEQRRIEAAAGAAMTRAEIEREYKVVDGVIRSPGKFEGEPVYAPYFWDAFLSGMVDEDDGEYLYFDVNDDDRRIFPELKDVNRVSLREDDQGFVRVGRAR